MTGGGGWIGQALQRQVAALDVHTLPHRRELPALWELPSWEEGDVLVHLGWYVDPRDYLHSDENKRCHSASLLLIERALDKGLRVVGVGSCLEYGRGGGPHRETDLLAPHAAYSQSKAALAQYFGAHPGLTWARLFHLFGPGEHPTRLVPTVLHALENRHPVALRPAHIRRDWLTVEEAAVGLAWLVRQTPGGAVNLCAGQSWSLQEFLEPTAALFQGTELLHFGARPLQHPAEERLTGDASKLQSLGFRPSLPAPEALRAYASSRSAAVRSGAARSFSHSSKPSLS